MSKNGANTKALPTTVPRTLLEFRTLEGILQTETCPYELNPEQETARPKPCSLNLTPYIHPESYVQSPKREILNSANSYLSSWFYEFTLKVVQIRGLLSQGLWAFLLSETCQGRHTARRSSGGAVGDGLGSYEPP